MQTPAVRSHLSQGQFWLAANISFNHDSFNHNSFNHDCFNHDYFNHFLLTTFFQ